MLRTAKKIILLNHVHAQLYTGVHKKNATKTSWKRGREEIAKVKKASIPRSVASSFSFSHKRENARTCIQIAIKMAALSIVGVMDTYISRLSDLISISLCF